jgi:23S rRNA pseudouridine1911/1915/1917 synthase
VEAGKRLDEFLASRIGGLSRMQIAKLIGQGACLVNGIAERGGYKLNADNIVEITLNNFEPGSMNAEQIPLEILFEDQHIIVIVKPAGMLAHPSKAERSGTLANALTYHLNREFFEKNNPEESLLIQDEMQALQRPGIVHRLDRATSGLMVIAKTQRALSILTRHFHHRMVAKRYMGVISGELSEDIGSIVAPIGRDPERRPQWWIVESGRYAETRYRVLERKGFASLVEMEPVTGRTNQLRIHFAYCGHPIIGDQLYSNGNLIESDQISRTASRLCLHASMLAFHHPANGQWMEFESRLPAEIAEVMGE